MRIMKYLFLNNIVLKIIFFDRVRMMEVDVMFFEIKVEILKIFFLIN